MILGIFGCTNTSRDTAKETSSAPDQIDPDRQITMQIKGAGSSVEYLIDGVTYKELENESHEVGFLQYYGWDIDLERFEQCGHTDDGKILYCSSADEEDEFLILEEKNNGENKMKFLAKDSSTLHNWEQFSDAFFDTAIVEHIVTKASYLSPVLQAHFNGIVNVDFEDSLYSTVYQNHCYASISLEVKTIPGLWYNFYSLGDETTYVYSRSNKGFVDLGKPNSFVYGIVLPVMSNDIASMLNCINEYKESYANTGYWFEDSLICDTRLEYENSLLIPILDYLEKLPCRIELDDNNIIKIYRQSNDSEIEYEYIIDLENKTVSSSIPPLVLLPARIMEDSFLIENRNGTWFIDYHSFTKIMEMLAYDYSVMIDNEENCFSLSTKGEGHLY